MDLFRAAIGVFAQIDDRTVVVVARTVAEINVGDDAVALVVVERIDGPQVGQSSIDQCQCGGGGGTRSVCKLKRVARVHSDVSGAAQVITNGQSFYGTEVEVTIGLIRPWVRSSEVSHLDHVAHLLIKGRDFQAGSLCQDLLETQLVVNGLFRAQVWIGDQIVPGFNEEVVNGREAVVRRRTLSQNVVVGEEYRLVADVERERHTWHDVHLWFVIFKRLGSQFGIRTFDQPRSRVHLVDGKDVGVIDFRSRSIEPSISVPVAYDGRWSFQGIDVNGKVVSDVSRDGGTIFELIDQVTAQVTNFVVLTDDIWIL